jgi:hypothetical protein
LGKKTCKPLVDLLIWKKGERRRKGGTVGVGPTVGLTGFVDTRYCRYRSVELVYPCVDARF